MKIGRYEVNRLDAGRFRLDGGAMFGVVPKVLWEKQKPADEKNRIQMATNLLLIEGEGRRILVDTGLGDKSDSKFASIYAIDHSQFSLPKALRARGLSPRDITDVILTHLHFDHAGGATVREEATGEIKPTFPNAKYYVQKRQFAWAVKPSERDRASYLQENFIPLQEHNQLIVLEEEGELFPDIELYVVDGHTPGHQMVVVRGENTGLLYAGDLIPTAAHVPIPWVMAYDLEPLKTIAEKKQFLRMAVDQGWMVFFEHDPEVYCATVQATEKGFAVKEVVEW